MRLSTKRALWLVKHSLLNCWRHFRLRWRHGDALERYCRDKQGILLNVGCGDLIHSGWINVDVAPLPGAFYFNALDPLPMQDGSVAHIHMEHFLEHLDFVDANRLLRECSRVLQIGGTLRVIVPDAALYMQAYASNDTGFFNKLAHLGGTEEPLPTPAAICSQAFLMGGDHLFTWDYPTLALVAQQNGFSQIQRSKINDPATPHCIDGQDWWRETESLYVDLIK